MADTMTKAIDANEIKYGTQVHVDQPDKPKSSNGYVGALEPLNTRLSTRFDNPTYY